MDWKQTGRRTGDESSQRRAFEKLIRPHLDRLYRQAFWLTRQRHDAEDLVQDVLIKLYPRCGELQALDKPGPWLARVLHRTFIDNYRRHQRQALHIVTTDEPEKQQSSEPEYPDRIADSPALQMDIEAGLERLNEDQRLVILMHDVEGYSLVELERILGVPSGTLKSRLHRGRAALRKFLLAMEPFAASERVTP
ncbi:MAG: RNA polymerase sigma factor [Gammaproteobacteria bacterium]